MPEIDEPDDCGGISTSVVPDDGKFWRKPSTGIESAAEQSNVPFVTRRKIVGTPAFALVILGEYPPLTSKVIICLPFSTETLLTSPADC